MKIIKCPFCGCQLQIEKYAHMKPIVVCPRGGTEPKAKGCGFSGPEAETVQEAIREVNRVRVFGPSLDVDEFYTGKTEKGETI